MFHKLKKFIRSLTPSFILSWYHLFLANIASFYYGQPSKKLIVIGVTGTNGKSTTVNLIAKILEQAGNKVAISSTVNFKTGDSETLNKLKMTMPGRFFLQKLLAESVAQGCTYAIIESSSEGILQHRQIGIHYDAMVYTNLTPEHIQAHKGFENYKNAKLEYFRNLEKLPHKMLHGKQIDKVIAVNSDDQYSKEFSNFKADKIVAYGTNDETQIKGSNLFVSPEGISFEVNGVKLNLKLKGRFDFYNAMAAIAVCSAYGVDLQVAKQALEKIPVVPGRMETFHSNKGFTVVVDYAPEPESLKQLYETIESWTKNKIIHLLGSTGGGRDVARRKILGQIAGSRADIVIVTNEDPYEDDPKQIIHDVADGAIEAGKVIKENLFREPDRRLAIAKALSKANSGDIVLITGKGSEQKMAVAGGYIPWDDREVVKEELTKLN